MKKQLTVEASNSADLDNPPIRAAYIASGKLIPCKRGENGAVLRDNYGKVLPLELRKP